MDFNTIYEVKETKPVDGYILDDTPYYIMRVKKEDSGNDYSDDVKEYIKIAYQNSKDKHYIVAYDKDYFLVKIYNAQQGITVKKAFTNNAAETEHNPVSGTYRFGLYDTADGTGDRLDYIEIKYDSSDTGVKSAKFKNPVDLTKTYYVFELDDQNQPIKASDNEATINSMQYKVVYKNETNSTETNSAKVGETVTVTNKSRTKILPSTGSMGTLIYRLLGATLVVASLICLSNINKNKRKEKKEKEMKLIKKIAAIMFAFMMVFSLSTNAKADENSGDSTATGTITIENSNAGQTYNLYRILDLESYNNVDKAYSYKLSSKWTGFLEYEGVDAYLKKDNDYVTWVNAKQDEETTRKFVKLALKYAGEKSIVEDESVKNDSETIKKYYNRSIEIRLLFGELYCRKSY